MSPTCRQKYIRTFPQMCPCLGTARKRWERILTMSHVRFRSHLLTGSSGFSLMYFTIPLQATRLVLASQRCHVFFLSASSTFCSVPFAFYFCTKEALKRFDRGCMLRFCLDLCCLISESFTVDQQPFFHFF